MPDCGSHCRILTELFCIQFRVSSGQIQSAASGGQSDIPQRAEKDRFGTGCSQFIQCFGIAKAKRLVPCHRNGDMLRRRLRCDRFCRIRATAQFQNLWQIQCLLCLLPQGIHPFGQVCNFPGSIQSKVAALKLCLLHRRQISQYRQAGFPFQHGFQRLVEHRFAIVQKNSRQMTVRPEVLQPTHRSRQGQTCPLGAQYQQHGQLQRIRQMPGTGTGCCAANSVIISHYTFADSCTMPCCIPRKQRTHRFFRREK